MTNCPVCKNPLPFFRGPTNFRQAMLGGWTCGYCKSEINRRGNLIKKNQKGLKDYEEKMYREEYIKEKARLQARKDLRKE